MAAEFEKTSFGIQRRRRAASELSNVRQTVAERIEFVTDNEKRRRLELLRTAIDDVLEDLKD